MDIKRQIYYHVRHIYRQVQRVKTWQLLLVLMLSGFVAASFLRLNNVGMAERRKAVLAADSEGLGGDVSDRMLDLQHYVASHMNTSTGQFYLEDLYNRDRQDAIEEAVNDSNPNGNINALAEAVCAPKFSVYTQAYLQCFIDELNKYPAAPDVDTEVDLPNPALYRHSFAAPLWSPDFAGFSVLFFAVTALVIIGRWFHFGFFTLLLKLRRKGIGS